MRGRNWSWQVRGRFRIRSIAKSNLTQVLPIEIHYPDIFLRDQRHKDWLVLFNTRLGLFNWQVGSGKSKMRAGSQPELYDIPNSRYNEVRGAILGYLNYSMQVFIVTLVIASTTGMALGNSEWILMSLTRMASSLHEASLRRGFGYTFCRQNEPPSLREASHPSHVAYKDCRRSGCKQGKVLHHSAVTFRIAMIGQLMASRLQNTGKMKECLWNNYKKGTSSTMMHHLIYISKLVVVRPGFQYTNTKGNPENQFPISVRIAWCIELLLFVYCFAT